MLAILVCLLANGIIFAFAKATHSTTAERFAVSEFYQVSASALLVLAVTGGALGLLIGWWGSRLLGALVPSLAGLRMKRGRLV